MSALARFLGRVEKGAVVFDQPAKFRAELARHEGKRVEIALGRERKARSTTANAYLWGVVYRTLEEWSGHDADELHEHFKSIYCPPRELRMPTGEVIEVRSTALLNSAEFGEYVSKVKRWAAENGVFVPEPGEFEFAL